MKSDLENESLAKLSEAYKMRLTLSLSDPNRFAKALQVYGVNNIYEAIILASTREIIGDPLSYVLTIAHNLWKEERKEQESEARYEMRLQNAKLTSKEQGERLAEKIEKARQKRK